MIDGVLARLERVEMGLRAPDPRTLRNRIVALGQSLYEAEQERADQRRSIATSLDYLFLVTGCNGEPIVGATVTAQPNTDEPELAVWGVTDGQGLALVRPGGFPCTWTIAADRYATITFQLPVSAATGTVNATTKKSLSPENYNLHSDTPPSYACVADCGPKQLNGVITDGWGAVAMSVLSAAVGSSKGFQAAGGGSATFYYTLNPISGTASATATVAADGTISGITLGSAGIGYYGHLPTVIIDPPPAWAWPQRQATAHAVLADDAHGTLASIQIDDAGAGYDPPPAAPPTVGISAPTSVAYELIASSAAGGGGTVYGSVIMASYACAPFSATFDFAGTAADGTIFNSTSGTVAVWTET